MSPTDPATQQGADRGHAGAGKRLKDVTGPAYDRRGRFRAEPDPELSFEIRVVRGEEARRLRMGQAEAIKDLLVWLRSRYLSEEGHDREQGDPGPASEGGQL